MAPKKPPRQRTERRQKHRDLKKVVRKLDRLVIELPGGSADRAFVVSTPSVVEVRARATPCHLCEGELELRDHRAEERNGKLFRVVDLVCRACHHPRALWFRVAAPIYQ